MITITKSLDYAMRSLVALSQARSPLTLRELSGRTRVSHAYLAKVMGQLARRGIVQSVPGTRGGYRLLRSPEEISLREIWEAVGGGSPGLDCWQFPEVCSLAPDCSQRPVWQTLREEILTLFERKKLSDFLPEPAFVPYEKVQKQDYTSKEAP